MDPQQNNAPGADSQPNHSTEEFLRQAQQPTIAAEASPSGPGYAPPAPGNSPAPGASQPYVAPQGAEPMFTRDDADPLADELPQNQRPKARTLSEDYKYIVIRGYLVMENRLTSGLCAAIAGIDDATMFASTDEEIDELVQLLEPYKDMIVEKLPPWVPLLVGYLYIKVRQSIKLVKYIKQRNANRAAAGDEGTMSRVAAAVNNTGERKNFLLYADGYYRNDRKGIYISNREKNRNKLEKPDVNDLEKILAVNGNRHRDLLKAAFGWTDADCQSNGITE